MFYNTKGVTVNKRPASSVKQSNKPQARAWQSERRSKPVAKLVAALCKSGVECFGRPWLLEESFAFALALTL